MPKYFHDNKLCLFNTLTVDLTFNRNLSRFGGSNLDDESQTNNVQNGKQP